MSAFRLPMYSVEELSELMDVMTSLPSRLGMTINAVDRKRAEIASRRRIDPLIKAAKCSRQESAGPSERQA